MWLIFRKKPYLMTWIGCLFAFVGLVFLTGNGFGQIQLHFGQIITIIGSIAIALEIIFIGYFFKRTKWLAFRPLLLMALKTSILHSIFLYSFTNLCKLIKSSYHSLSCI